MGRLKKLGMAFACTALVLACAVFAGVEAHAGQASVGADGAAVVAGALPEPVAEAPPAPGPALAPEEAALPAPADASVDAPDQALSEAAPLAAPEALAAVAAEAGAPPKIWWQNEDGVMRFYGGDGVVRTGLFEVNGKQYWADATGAAQTGVFWDWPAGSIRYADPMSLELQTGLQWVGSDLYYFENYLGVQGWTKLEGFDCYFGEYFTAPNGVAEIAGDGSYYFENGRSAGDWFQAVDDEVYFFGGEKGKALTGYFKVGDAAYFAGEDGALMSGVFWDWGKYMQGIRAADPVTYQLRQRWFTTADGTYYFDIFNYLSFFGTRIIDDVYYHFNRTTGLLSPDVPLTYFDVFPYEPGPEPNSIYIGNAGYLRLANFDEATYAPTTLIPDIDWGDGHICVLVGLDWYEKPTYLALGRQFYACASGDGCPHGYGGITNGGVHGPIDIEIETLVCHHVEYAWRVTQKPTESAPGRRIYICVECGHTLVNEEIPRLSSAQ